MHKFLLVILWVCLSTLSIYSQNSIQNPEELARYYSKEIQKNHKLYLQLNKTKVLPGENIWFSSYLLNYRTFKPVRKPVKIFTAVFDSNGNEVNKGIFLSVDGKSNGYLSISEEKLPPGHYQFQAVANLPNKPKFIHNFEIIGSKYEKAPLSVTNFDLQLLPESGNLIEDVWTTIGVKLIGSDGRGIDFGSGAVIDKVGDTITTFKSNRIGLSKFNIRVSTDDNFSVVVKPEDTNLIRKPLPEINSRGINISTQVLKEDFFLNVKTNKATLDEIKNNKFYLGVGMGEQLKIFQTKFSNKTVVNVKIPLDSLNPGMNQATIFNQDFKPLAEKLFFNPIKDAEKPVELEIVENQGDSLVVGLKSAIETKMNLSLSVLPEGNQSYGEQLGIVSAMTLEPYIRGNLENPEYYFNRKVKERKRLYNLDLLLLTQGWTRFKWNNKPESKTIDVQPGFTLKGRIQKDLDGNNKVIVKSNTSGLFEIANADKNGNFELDSLFILEGSKISIAMLGADNSSDPGIYARILPRPEKIKFNSYIGTKKEIKDSVAIENLGDVGNFIVNTTSLDTVQISTNVNKKDKQKRDPFMRSTAVNRVVEIDKGMEKTFPSIINLIRSRGFRVRNSMYGPRIYNLDWIEGTYKPTLIYLDGIKLDQSAVDLMNLGTDEVVAISLSKSRGQLLQASFSKEYAGIIRIQTKYRYGNWKNERDQENSGWNMTADIGFSEAKEYYNPKYRSYATGLFNDYGVIDWKPMIYLPSKEASRKFKILNTATENLSFYIEGFGINGELISEKIDVQL